jgi:hypothetical protein
VNQNVFARRACLALALAVFAGTAAAGADREELCSGSSTACLEQISAALSARDSGGGAAGAPKARRAGRAEPPRPQGASPRLNLDQTLSAPIANDNPGG